MKEYVGSDHKCNMNYALPHINANGIKCRYYKWVGMAGKIDVLKIDGHYRRFNIDTHMEVR